MTDANYCSATASIVITETPILASSQVVTDAICNGTSTGAIDLTVSGGTAPYTYVWSTGETTEDISSKAVGTYFVTITDAKNCTLITSAKINEPVAMTIAGVVANVSCNGGSNGAIDISISNGIGALTYNWDGGITSEDRASLIAGTYNVTVTDANGCTVSQSFTISEPSALTLSTTQTNISCNGTADGSIELTVAGGTNPVTYLWSTGVTTKDISGLNAANYIVTVTDANGCTAISSATLTQPDTIAVTPSVSNALCFGGNTGSISITNIGGTSPYTYAWSNGATTANINTLTAGTYTLTVTDANGCTSVTNHMVSEPAQKLEISATNNNVSCFGGNDGSIVTTSIGGTTPYSYMWSTGATTANISGLTAGTYKVTLTDNNLCSTVDSFTLIQPAAALTLSSINTDVTCNGNANGSVDLTVNGGTLPYTYKWSNGPTTQNINALVAGTYTVTVTDDKNCTSTLSTVINQPLTLSLTATVINAGCEGENKGAVNLTVNGGVIPYTFNWSNGAISEDITNLVAGTYAVTVTDTNKCTQTLSQVVTENANPIAKITATEGSCTVNDEKIVSGDNVNLVASGGVTYTWDNGLGSGASHTATPSVLTTYNVTVTDINGCIATASKKIDIISGATASIISNESLCTTNDDKILSGGEVSFSASGGISYAWSNALGTGSDKVVNPTVNTTYTVTVTDVNGCTATSSKTIEIITAPIATIVSSENSCITNDDKILATDSIRLIASGSINYAWNNGLGTAADVFAHPFATTTYSVTVTDANGCFDIASKTIEVTPTPTVSIASVDTSCTNNDDKILVGASVTMTATGSLSYAWDNGLGTADVQTVTPSVTTTYTVTGTDANGCTATDSKTVMVANAPKAIISGILAIPKTDTSTTLTATGGNSYFWSTTEITDSIVVAPKIATKYAVSIVDANGCIDTTSVTVLVNDVPVATDDNLTLLENDSSTVVNILLNDTFGANGADTVAITIIQLPSNGIASVNDNGTPNDPTDDSVSYKPYASFNGKDTLIYQICDIDGDCDTAILVITVNSVADAPIAGDDNFTTNEDTPVSGTVATNDSDVDGDPLTFTAITNVPASQGVLVFNPDGTFTFTPAANFNGVLAVNYKVCDATLCDTATLTITVNAINDAPIALDDYESTNEDTPLIGTVAINDKDTEGDALTFTAITNVPTTQGVLVLNSDGTYTFTPALNFNGVVTVSYQVCDATLCDTATLTITVNPINDAPIAADDNISTDEETPVSGTVATNDSDIDGDILTFTAITNVPASQGVFVLNPNGSYTFTPAANFNGTVYISLSNLRCYFM